MPILIHGSSKPPMLQQKQVKPSTVRQDVTPDGEYDGLSNVIVSPISLQEKAITPTETQQIVTPDSGYDGLSKVTIASAPSTSSGVNKIEFTPDDLMYESGIIEGSKDFIAFDIGASSINGFSIVYKGYSYSTSDGNYFANESDSCLFSMTMPSDAMSHPVSYSFGFKGGFIRTNCYYAVIIYRASNGNYIFSQRMFFMADNMLYIFPDRIGTTSTAASIIDYMADGAYDFIYW